MAFPAFQFVFMSSCFLTEHYWQGLTVFFTPTPEYLSTVISDNKLSQFFLTSPVLQHLNCFPDSLLDLLWYIRVAPALRNQGLHPAVPMWHQQCRVEEKGVLPWPTNGVFTSAAQNTIGHLCCNYEVIYL